MELGGFNIKAILTIDAESVFTSLSSKDLQKPTECTLLGRISWKRQMIDRDVVHGVQWCGTRDMAAEGYAKGCIDRSGLTAANNEGQSVFSRKGPGPR
eukprot:5208025-Pyramimonas_sp.AAC.1